MKLKVGSAEVGKGTMDYREHNVSSLVRDNEPPIQIVPVSTRGGLKLAGGGDRLDWASGRVGAENRTTELACENSEGCEGSVAVAVMNCNSHCYPTEAEDVCLAGPFGRHKIRWEYTLQRMGRPVVA